ncbi:hypothetical protein [Streptomyces sp. NEAU-W12]|uniref:phosphorylase family protein n=1 Tax=Streptomyces sp. NEAU-W12 TaxID=2994668 RepID=UPI00224AAE4F|nr:hypothetical protein [Streptomyces sp. NEAU-W12]MCX2928076.1 hypothetical protein [Streptomyces sp. NEAU-W12]
MEGAAERTVTTDHGVVTVTEGRLRGTEIVQLSRHGAGHHRLSSQVDHKANLAALLACEAEAVVSFTVCGSLDPAVRPGSLVVFDDLYFPANRLPDGTPCTWYDTVRMPPGPDRCPSRPTRDGAGRVVEPGPTDMTTPKRGDCLGSRRAGGATGVGLPGSGRLRPDREPMGRTVLLPLRPGAHLLFMTSPVETGGPAT